MKVKAIFDKIKRQHRLTKARQDMIELLAKHPMNIHELEKAMLTLGHPNIQTIYNNISFLQSMNIVFATLEDGHKLYHLVDFDQDVTTSINMKCHASQETFQITEPKIVEVIKRSLNLSKFKVNHLDITIQGACHAIDEDHCDYHETCVLKQITEQYRLS
ncbi:MAG: transcriptional repressor [Tenericutes bacterium]|nr:transcriptional repressor [Mycoplasmatota bacterium]